MKRHCQNCRKIFEPTRGNVKQGYGKYCSRSCRNIGAGLGYKKSHGSYWTEESRKKFRKSTVGENHWAWKENPSYHTLHRWVAQNKGRPKKCKECGLNDEKRTYDWANIDHTYKRDLDDFIRLCRSCHRKHDYKNNLSKRARNVVNV